MAPSFLKFKELRRRSRASFRAEESTDTSSEESRSHGHTPTSGSLTPPSLAHQSDTALNLQLKGSPGAVRPPLQPNANGNPSKRYSVPGMAGLGSPMAGGRSSSFPVSQYSPRITNINDNSWVGGLSYSHPPTLKNNQKRTGTTDNLSPRSIKKSC